MVKKLMARTWTLSPRVPSDKHRALIEHDYRKISAIIKYLKRRIFCYIFIEYFGFNSELKVIQSQHQRILWVNWSAPSLGDSLMDLSSRVLLRDREITLLTHPNNVQLYIEDDVFKFVYAEPARIVAELGRGYFDLVICDAFSPRVLLRKLLVEPRAPFVGMYGFLNSFEIHRTYFSFHRMQELLGVTSHEHAIRPLIKTYREQKIYDVCIAVGGEWGYRTYSKWPLVVGRLLDLGLSVVLVGSSNGIAASNSICDEYRNVCSLVGTLGIAEVVREIAKAKVFVGADGGLWHIACAIPVPSVVLFADCQIFDETGARVTRETRDIECETLYDEVEVSRIDPESVVNAYQRLEERLARS